MLRCPYCGGNVGEACCGGASQVRVYQCSSCHKFMRNPKWDGFVVIDGYGEHFTDDLLEATVVG